MVVPRIRSASVFSPVSLPSIPFPSIAFPSIPFPAIPASLAWLMAVAGLAASTTAFAQALDVGLAPGAGQGPAQGQGLAAQMVHWSLDHPHCAGTLVAPRVMLTAGSCAGRQTRGRTYALTDGGAARGRLVRYQGRIGPIGDIAVMLLDKPLAGKAVKGMAAVPSYAQERIALVDGAADMSDGTRLVAYGSAAAMRAPRAARAPYQGLRMPRRATAYLLRDARAGDSTAVGRPLIYRSVAGYRLAEPQRIDGSSPQQLFGSLVMRAFYPNRKRRSGDAVSHQRGDRELDEMVLLTAGRASDAAAGIASPLRHHDRGGGLFAVDGEQREWLVGTVLGAQLHARQSEYWPWLYATLQRYGMRAEALQLARQVLGTGRWGDNDRQGTVGDIYVYENPYTRRVEFFRLIGLDKQGRYGYFPNGGRDNAYWEHLGSELPTAAEATARIRAWQADTREAKKGEVFVRVHPTAGSIEYFRLKADVPGALSEPPVDAASNAEWEYLGANLVV